MALTSSVHSSVPGFKFLRHFWEGVEMFTAGALIGDVDSLWVASCPWPFLAPSLPSGHREVSSLWSCQPNISLLLKCLSGLSQLLKLLSHGCCKCSGCLQHHGVLRKSRVYCEIFIIVLHCSPGWTSTCSPPAPPKFWGYMRMPPPPAYVSF